MDIRKCARCGRFFQTVRSPYCGACQDAIDQDCRQIRNYIVVHPDATAADIAAALAIDERTILHLLREGRLELKAQPPEPCQGCGLPIHSGRYCPDCLGRLTRHLGHGANHKDGRDGSRNSDNNGGGSAADDSRPPVRPSGPDLSRLAATPGRNPDQQAGGHRSDNPGPVPEKPNERGMHVKRTK